MYLRAACFTVSGNVSQCVAWWIKALPLYMYLLISSLRASSLRWNRGNVKLASTRCCKTSGGNKLPSGAVRLCGRASVNFHLKASTLENQNVAKEKINNSYGEDGGKEEKCCGFDGVWAFY